MTTKELLFKLSEADGVGCVNNASDIAFEIMDKYTTATRMSNLSIIGMLKGKSNYTIMIDAHIDQIAMVVTNVDDNGFITVAKSGGIDIRTLPARQVTVHGRRIIPAVFCSTPPHLKSGEKEYKDISEIKLDSGLGSNAKQIVNVGDYVTFSAKPIELKNDIVSGRSFDDRSGVCCILMLAERLYNKNLPCNIAFVLSDGEELGMRGVRTATYSVEPNEGIAIDVSFGDAIGIPEDETGKISGGPMIGIAPSLDRNVSNGLIKIAEDNNIKYQLEVMGSVSGTNADMISISQSGVKTCTVSIPLRNMHTDTELLSISDIDATCDLLEKYILSGGQQNA